MSQFERIWPARGGKVNDGDFEYWTASTLNYWSTDTGGGSAALAKSTSHKSGSYSARLKSGSGGEYIKLYQDISDYADYSGFRMTFSCWVKASEAGAYIYVSTAAGTVIGSSYHSGSGSWERLRVMVDIPASPSLLQVGMMWDPASSGVYAYFDACALVMGDTYGTVTLETHTYPVAKPTSILTDEEITADGVSYFGNALVQIIRPLNFDGMSASFFQKLQNFINYVVEGPVYSFNYTDDDGNVFTAHILSDSFSDGTLIGPMNIYRGSVTLKLTDRGLS